MFLLMMVPINIFINYFFFPSIHFVPLFIYTPPYLKGNPIRVQTLFRDGKLYVNRVWGRMKSFVP